MLRKNGVVVWVGFWVEAMKRKFASTSLIHGLRFFLFAIGLLSIAHVALADEIVPFKILWESSPTTYCVDQSNGTRVNVRDTTPQGACNQAMAIWNQGYACTHHPTAGVPDCGPRLITSVTPQGSNSNGEPTACTGTGYQDGTIYVKTGPESYERVCSSQARHYISAFSFLGPVQACPVHSTLTGNSNCRCDIGYVAQGEEWS
jgi:hypothetical protein